VQDLDEGEVGEVAVQSRRGALQRLLDGVDGKLERDAPGVADARLGAFGQRDVVAVARATPGQFSEAALEAIEQKVFALALDPESSAREVKGLAQILMKRGDQEIRKRDQDLARERLADSRERWRESLKSAIDRGLDALYEDIAGNPEAEALFERLRAAVGKSVAEADCAKEAA
jgi:hypothetical protein